MSKFVIFLIRLYQNNLSRDHSWWARGLNLPPFCPYYPTCSQYMIDAIEKKGLARGMWLGIKRLLRCHPFSAGGIDEVK